MPDENSPAPTPPSSAPAEPSEPAARPQDTAPDDGIAEGPVERVELEAHQVVLQSRSFSSPFLPPDVLRAYNEVEPGLAAQAVQLVIDEQRHRHERERAADRRDEQAAATEAGMRRRGQWFGIAAVGMFSTVAIVGYATGEGAGATIFGSVVLVGLVTAFLGTRGRGASDRHLPPPDAASPSEGVSSPPTD